MVCIQAGIDNRVSRELYSALTRRCYSDCKDNIVFL